MPEMAARIPFSVTVTPPRERGRGIVFATALVEAKFFPNIDIREPGVTTPGVKLAEFSAPRPTSNVGALVPGVTFKLKTLDCPPSGFVTWRPTVPPSLKTAEIPTAVELNTTT